jgi:hypothetical protein
MDKLNTSDLGVRFVSGNQIDRLKWDRCIGRALNGNICAYSWFLDIMCAGWSGLVAGDYAYIMPLPLNSRFGITYLLQPRFVQQLGVFGVVPPDEDVIKQFIDAIPLTIKVIDYHFNTRNRLIPEWNVKMRTNLVLKIDKTYEAHRLLYAHNLIRNLKKSSEKGFYKVQNNDFESLIKLFRKEKGSELSFLKDKNYWLLTRVLQACLNRNKADVWSVYNRENELCGGIVWLFSHDRAVLYFSAQRKTGRAEGALAWLIDAFIQENAASGILLDFEGSVRPGLARFYAGFGALAEYYPRLIINRLSPFLKKIYSWYRKMKKD